MARIIRAIWLRYSSIRVSVIGIDNRVLLKVPVLKYRVLGYQVSVRFRVLSLLIHWPLSFQKRHMLILYTNQNDDRSTIIYYLLVDCKCTHGTTVSRLACFGSLASIHEPVLTFWQSDRKGRLKGNLSGLLKTGVGPAGSHPMAVSYDYISGRVHVPWGFSIGRYSEVPGTAVLWIFYW